MNRPLFALGVSLALFAVFLLWSVASVAQEFDASMTFTAQGQGYWVVMVDGEQVSQHTTEREAYESATNQWFITDGAQIQVIHNAVIDVDGSIAVTGLPEPEIIERIVEVIVEVPGPETIVEVEKIVETVVEVPVEVIVEVPVIQEVIVEIPVNSDGDPIGIPGSSIWGGVPEGLLVQQFKVMNDDWAVATNNMYLYAYNVTVDNGSGWIVHRPGTVYQNGYVQSETTESLTAEQVVNLITAMAYE